MDTHLKAFLSKRWLVFGPKCLGFRNFGGRQGDGGQSLYHC